jgi:hypothetical protein
MHKVMNQELQRADKVADHPDRHSVLEAVRAAAPNASLAEQEPRLPVRRFFRHATLRQALTVLTLAADLALLAMIAAHAAGALRYWSGLLVVLWAPGWALARFLKFDWLALELSIAFGGSLAFNLVVSLVLLLAHAWHPLTAVVVVGILLVPALLLALIGNAETATNVSAPRAPR